MVAGSYRIFILECILTLCFGIVAFIVPDFPEQSEFLDNEERAAYSQSYLQTAVLSNLVLETQVTFAFFLTGKFGHCKQTSEAKFTIINSCSGSTTLFFSCNMGASSIASLSPTFLKQLGWTNSQAQSTRNALSVFAHCWRTELSIQDFRAKS
jgi:hypothetical protein